MRRSDYPDYLGTYHPDRPLPAGSVISNNGNLAIVIEDYDDDVVLVDNNGVRAEWDWVQGYEVLYVVTVNDDAADVTNLTAQQIIDLIDQPAATRGPRL